MKKAILTLLTLLTLVVMSITTVIASANESCRHMKAEEVPQEQTEAAEKLYKLGLFRPVCTNDDGTPNFALNYYTTRIQGIIIYTDFMGADTTTLENTSNFCFDDITDRQAPYISYAMDNNYIHGVSRTRFEPNIMLTADHFLTTALIILEYNCGKDFGWCDSWNLTDIIDLTSGEYSLENNNISRGEMTVILLKMLTTNLKDQDLTLLDKMLENDTFENLAEQGQINSGKLLKALETQDKEVIRETIMAIINGTDCDYDCCCCPICCDCGTVYFDKHVNPNQEPRFENNNGSGATEGSTATSSNPTNRNNQPTPSPTSPGNNTSTDNKDPDDDKPPESKDPDEGKEPEDGKEPEGGKEPDDGDKDDNCTEEDGCDCTDCKDKGKEDCTGENDCDCADCKDKNKDDCTGEECYNCTDCKDKEKEDCTGENDCDCADCKDKDNCDCTGDDNCDCTDCKDKVKDDCTGEDDCDCTDCKDKVKDDCTGEDDCDCNDCKDKVKDDCNGENDCNCTECKDPNIGKEDCDNPGGCDDPNCPKCKDTSGCDNQDGCGDPDCPDCNPNTDPKCTNPDCDDPDCKDPNCTKSGTWPKSFLDVTDEGDKTTTGNVGRWFKVYDTSEVHQFSTSFTRAVKTDSCFHRQASRTVFTLDKTGLYETFSFTAYNNAPFTARIRVYDYEAGKLLWERYLNPGVYLYEAGINITGVNKIELSAEIIGTPLMTLDTFYNAVYLFDPIVDRTRDNDTGNDEPCDCGESTCPDCGDNGNADDGKCQDCGNELCYFCGNCEDCGDCDHCHDCGGSLCEFCVVCIECGICDHCLRCSGELCDFCGNCLDCEDCDHCLDCGGELCDYCGNCEDCGVCEHCFDCGGELCDFCEKCLDCEDCEHCFECNGDLCEECGECVGCSTNPCQFCCSHGWGEWVVQSHDENGHTLSRSCSKCDAYEENTQGHTRSLTSAHWVWNSWDWISVMHDTPIEDLLNIGIVITNDSCRYRYKLCVVCGYQEHEVENHKYNDDWDMRNSYDVRNPITGMFDIIPVEPYYLYTPSGDIIPGSDGMCVRYKSCINHGFLWNCPRLYDEPEPHVFNLYNECDVYEIFYGGKRQHSFALIGVFQWYLSLSEIGNYDEIVTWLNDSRSIVICRAGWCSRCRSSTGGPALKPQVNGWHEWEGMCRRTIVCVSNSQLPFSGPPRAVNQCNEILYEETKPHNIVGNTCVDCGYKERNDLCDFCDGELCEDCGECIDCGDCEHCPDCGGELCEDCNECKDCSLSPCEECCLHSWSGWAIQPHDETDCFRSRSCSKCDAIEEKTDEHTVSLSLESWAWDDMYWITTRFINSWLPDITVTLGEDACQFRYRECVVCSYLEYEIEDHKYNDDWDMRDVLYVTDWDDELGMGISREVPVEPHYIYRNWGEYFLGSTYRDMCCRVKFCQNPAGQGCPIFHEYPEPHELKLYNECSKWAVLHDGKRYHIFYTDWRYTTLEEIGSFDEIVEWVNDSKSWMTCAAGWCGKCMHGRNGNSLDRHIPQVNNWHEWEGMCRRTIVCISNSQADFSGFTTIDPCNDIIFEETKSHNIVGNTCVDCGYTDGGNTCTDIDCTDPNCPEHGVGNNKCYFCWGTEKCGICGACSVCGECRHCTDCNNMVWHDFEQYDPELGYHWIIVPELIGDGAWEDIIEWLSNEQNFINCFGSKCSKCSNWQGTKVTPIINNWHEIVYSNGYSVCTRKVTCSGCGGIVYGEAKEHNFVGNTCVECGATK